MYLSVFLSHIYKLAENECGGLSAAIRTARELGITAVECSCDELSAEPGLPRRLVSAGLSLSAVHGRADLVHGDAAEGLALIRLAAKAGAQRLLLLPGTASAAGEKAAAAGRIAEGLALLLPAAAELGVTLTLENFSSPLAPYSTSDELAALFDALPDLRWTLDSGNFRCVCEDAAEVSARLVSKAVNVHLKDWSLVPDPALGHFVASDGVRLYGAAVGSGVIPNREVLRILSRSGYGGPLTVELHGATAPYAALRKSCEFILNELK